jgi:hypothetical protein
MYADLLITFADLIMPYIYKACLHIVLLITLTCFSKLSTILNFDIKYIVWHIIHVNLKISLKINIQIFYWNNYGNY